jgi:beta-glucosidase
MAGNPVAEEQYNTSLKFSKLKPFAEGVNLNSFSAKFFTTFIPKYSGPVEIVYTSPGTMKLIINGIESKSEVITGAMFVQKLDVLEGKSYEIEADFVRTTETGEFRFTIQRNVNPDLNKILNQLKDIDVVVFAGGISSSLEREDANVYAPGFKGGDRTDIELPQVQRDLITALKASGKKVVLVNFSGSAMGLVPESQHCDAIMQAWYPGEAGGTAVVNVLLGNYNPSGRLPVTFYRNVDQLPDFQNYKMKDRTYRYMTREPLFSFGYGLSYTTFKYGKVVLDKEVIKPGETVKLTVPVTNTGKLDGEEVVQVYLKKNDDATGPNKTLRAFKRVAIHARKTMNVVFELKDENLEWWDSETNAMHMYAGAYSLLVGSSSRNNDLTSMSLKIN